MLSLETQFREVMAAVCTPVSIATALDGDHPHGTTVSAFTSLSMTPPMVLVSLDRGSELLTMVRRTRRFGLNVLAASQSGLAVAFARKGRDKFEGVSWGVDHDLPRIDGVIGWLGCHTARFVPGGDHVVVLGDVEIAAHCPGPPLTYHGRIFGTHRAYASSAPSGGRSRSESRQ